MRGSPPVQIIGDIQRFVDSSPYIPKSKRGKVFVDVKAIAPGLSIDDFLEAFWTHPCRRDYARYILGWAEADFYAARFRAATHHYSAYFKYLESTTPICAPDAHEMSPADDVWPRYHCEVCGRHYREIEFQQPETNGRYSPHSAKPEVAPNA